MKPADDRLGVTVSHPDQHCYQGRRADVLLDRLIKRTAADFKETSDMRLFDLLQEMHRLRDRSEAADQSMEVR